MHVCPDCQRCYEDSALSCTEEDHTSLSQIRDGGPDLIPGYLLDVFVGRGSGVETYYGRHIESGESCIVTMRAAAEALVSQFRKEAELAVRFCHPNVVDVYDSGRLESGEVFVVSEDAEGDTLHDILSTTGIPKLPITIQVIRQVAEALNALHTNGLAHGSINTRNIILTNGNRPFVRIKDIDLGGINTASLISSKFHDDDALYMFRYLAPEQCSGSGPSTRADTYSLGVVMYEMLAGEPPFNASKAAGLIEQHRDQRPPEVRIDDIDLRMLLTHTLSEALQKKPEMRQASANVFARQMRHIEQLATHSSIFSAPAAVPAIAFTPAPEKPRPIAAPSDLVDRAQAVTVSALIERRSVQWDQPEDDIPSETDVLESLSAEPHRVPLAAPSSDPALATTVFNTADNSALDDHVDAAAGDPGPAVVTPAIIDTVPVDHAGQLFSSLEAPSNRSFGSIGLRVAAMAVLLFAAALGVILIRNLDVTMPAAAEPPEARGPAVRAGSDHFETGPETYQEPVEPAAMDTAASRSEVVKVVEPKVLVTKDARSAVREALPVSTGKNSKDQVARPELIGKNLAPRPLPATIVITYGGEKPFSKVRLAGKPVAASRSEGTRPRIVKNPKP